MAFEIMLYGIGGADKNYKVLRWFCIDAEKYFSIRNIIDEAELLRINCPSIEHVYAVDNRFGLKREYVESIKKNSIESCAIFKDTLERDGLKVF